MLLVEIQVVNIWGWFYCSFMKIFIIKTGNKVYWAMALVVKLEAELGGPGAYTPTVPWTPSLRHRE